MAEVTPTELLFKFQLNKQLLATINVNNTGSTHLAYKIKTTAPKKYVVRPSSGEVAPNGNVTVQVIMQAQKEAPEDLKNCKDKFMVQTTVLAGDEKLGDTTFAKDGGREIKETRLRVVLDGPANPPAPVQEDMSEASAPAQISRSLEPATAASAVPATSDELTALKARLDALTKERDDMRKKVDMMELQGPSKPTASSKKASFSMLHILAVAIIAFLIGSFMGGGRKAAPVVENGGVSLRDAAAGASSTAVPLDPSMERTVEAAMDASVDASLDPTVEEAAEAVEDVAKAAAEAVEA